MISTKNFFFTTLLVISLFNVEICESGRILTEDALAAALNDPALAGKIPADLSSILPTLNESTIAAALSSNNISSDNIQDVITSNNISSSNIQDVIASNNISDIISSYNISSGSLPAMNASASQNANAVPTNVSSEIPTIPKLPDLSALSSFSLPPMPSVPKMPKIPSNVSIMGVNVPMPKFLTSMFDDQN
ncbi:hypothetical protein LUZ60_010352 [Juncus effusus]|nr:hypothetical protein LUZ60_010352 [Juncus effusus]